jgi:hypothetical protein
LSVSFFLARFVGYALVVMVFRLSAVAVQGMVM